MSLNYTSKISLWANLLCLEAKPYACYNFATEFIMTFASKSQKIRKVVIAVAGYGTRFLPATKTVPKEMLPIVDKPNIQYLVEEAVESGIKDVILVTRPSGQEVMEAHFKPNPDLETMLEKSGKDEILANIRKISKMANFYFPKQTPNLPYGNASPLLAAQDLIENEERFIYMFGDDMVLSSIPCVKQIIDYSDSKNKAVVVGVQEIPKSEINRYGIYKIAPGSTDRVIDAEEKPDPDSVEPPYLAQFGRFVLNHEILKITQKNAQNLKLGKNNEIWMIDQIIEYAKKNPVYAVKVKGEWTTTGDPLRYMKTQVKYALKRNDIGADFADFLKTLKL
jgi:UTP--glucose-1-phosphate uridylyltransferase